MTALTLFSTLVTAGVIGMGLSLLGLILCNGTEKITSAIVLLVTTIIVIASTVGFIYIKAQDAPSNRSTGVRVL